MEKLYLCENLISDIEILATTDFKNLKVLNLNGNRIYDIDILEIVNFKNLEKLGLIHNKILKNYDHKILEDLLYKIEHSNPRLSINLYQVK